MINTILQGIGFIIVGIVISTVFIAIRKFILKRSLNIAKTKLQQKYNPMQTNSSIGKVYKSPIEKVSGQKFASGMLSFFNPVLWLKDIFSLFNIRKLAIYMIILGVIFTYGWYQGTQGKPVELDLNYKEAVEIQVPKTDLRLYKPANSNKLYWIDKEGNKYPVTVSDIASLKKKLSPYGIELSPIGVVGAGMGYPDGVNAEFGAGVRFLHYWMFNLETFATNRGIYLGTSYRLDKLNLENSSIGVAYGKGWSQGEDRPLLYFSFKF